MSTKERHSHVVAIPFSTAQVGFLWIASCDRLVRYAKSHQENPTDGDQELINDALLAMENILNVIPEDVAKGYIEAARILGIDLNVAHPQPTAPGVH